MGTYDLARFRDAQDRGFGAPGSDYASALAEVRAGRKRSHWIWYVFPQVQGLGRSDFCHLYGVWGLGEASAYLADVCLRAIQRSAYGARVRGPVVPLPILVAFYVSSRGISAVGERVVARLRGRGAY